MRTKFLLYSLILFGLIFVIAGCGIARPSAPTPFSNAVATQVAVLLTSSPAAPTSQPPVSTSTQPPVITQAATATQPQPTAEPSQTPTQAPTATETPEPTAVEGDPREALGEPTFQDTKFKVNGNWGGPWKDDFTQGEFENNELLLTSIGVDGWTLSWPKIKDFYIEMTAVTGDCSGMDRYGLIVRVPESFDTGYLYGFTCDGKYSLRLWDPDKKKYNYLIDWTHSDEIKSGSDKTNRLGLMVEGDKFTLYANGVEIDSATDSTLEDKGRFGPYVGHAGEDKFTVYIKEISYWDLP